MGRLRPNPEDARKDTPLVVKNLISHCCEFSYDKRPSFVEVNIYFFCRVRNSLLHNCNLNRFDLISR
jgi:hypothetical protein